MARILLLLVIAFLVYMVIRALFRSQVKQDPPPAESKGVEGEEMVACARCGVNVPMSETREAEGRRICASNPNCK